MDDREAAQAALSQISGEVAYAASLAQIMCMAFARHNPEMRPKIEAALDDLLLQWENIAADPNHGIPGAVAHCRRRTEAFLGEFRQLMRA